jgi:hypothetical protein
MANPLHDRVPAATLASDRARESSSASTQTAPRNPSNVSLFTIRFAASAGLAAQLLPAMDLATDLIRASGGTLQAHDDQSLSASFPNLTVAVLIARRLQWALQGLAESGPRGDAVLLVQAATESVSPAPSTAAGQILLSPAATAAVRDLPSLAVRNPSDGVWSELLWQSPSQPVSYAADEQALLRLIRDCGREDPCVSKPSAAPAVISAPNPAVAYEVQQREIGFDPSESGVLDILKRHWMILGGAAVAVVLLIVVIGVATHRGAAPIPAAAPSLPATPAAGGPTTVPPTDTTPTLPQQPPHTPKSPPTISRKTSPPDSHTKKSADSATCDFTDAGIPRALSRAETDMHDGRLDQAKAAFLKLRGCSAARDRAEEGLRTVQRKIDAQALSHPN